MIIKTEKQFKRIAESGIRDGDRHVERVRVETWWVLFIPVYRSETIMASTM